MNAHAQGEGGGGVRGALINDRSVRETVSRCDHSAVVCKFIIMATPADSFLEEEPPRRHDVAMAVIDGKAYMWGGRDEWRNNMARYGASDIAVFDFETEHWEHRLTHGTQPLSAKGCAYASIGDVFYVCGGLLPGYYNNHNGLYALDTKTMVWTELTAADSSQGPRTASARMIPLREDKLVILDNDHQLHVFDLTKRE